MRSPRTFGYGLERAIEELVGTQVRAQMEYRIFLHLIDSIILAIKDLQKIFLEKSYDFFKKIFKKSSIVKMIFIQKPFTNFSEGD